MKLIENAQRGEKKAMEIKASFQKEMIEPMLHSLMLRVLNLSLE
jgi:hypothetical protein